MVSVVTKSGVMSGQVGVNVWILSVEPQKWRTLVSQTKMQSVARNCIKRQVCHTPKCNSGCVLSLLSLQC